MPGLFGGVSLDPERRRRLASEFESVWSGSDSIEEGPWFLGGHLRGPDPGLVRDPAVSSRWVAADGDIAVRGALSRVAEGELDLSGFPDVSLGDSVATCALADLAYPRILVGTSWSGAFPLYWTVLDGSTLFSSLLRPLARAVGAAVDPVGTAQFLREGHTLGGQTVFQGIRRLQPGQLLEISGPADARVKESSRAWASGGAGPLTLADQVERFSSSLLEKVSSDLSEGSPQVFMMSAGWDSRTLVGAAIQQGPRPPPAFFSHGDTEGRELGIVVDLAELAGTAVITAPIGPDAFDPDLLDRHFGRIESAVFPHWIRSSEILAEEGVASAMAGIFGEISGGHYGPSMIASGYLGKARALLSGLGLSGPPDSGSELAPEPLAAWMSERLSVPCLDRPWYLSNSGSEALTGPEVLGGINAGVEADLRRLVARGVKSRVTLLEAFISEHRGSQYIQAQALSLRSNLEISIPFAHRECFSLASWIPFGAKIHNRLNRALLDQWWPTGLSRPLAATLVPADAPLLFQEASRAVRRIYEGFRWAAHFRTAGRVPRPRLGWTDFDGFRDPAVHGPVVESLSSDLFDRAAIARALASLSDPGRPVHAQPYVDQMGKILTVDRLTR